VTTAPWSALRFGRECVMRFTTEGLPLPTASEIARYTAFVPSAGRYTFAQTAAATGSLAILRRGLGQPKDGR
jgi:hypothetical protein